ncbi:SIS domain-containing protein [Kineococcus radiotolerans]|uniref:Transcriptional regulator, RpiR family n=1 Tax=Kineococcus radiotolerans (strain ATCC BAA-149 / DSM 14245 / SRS30216) TaxID=266940 RepID=A6WER3_KINRD|nr:SIS domain-containing protein [Kineococcus radiotolerans]ABS05302.1 putative transcriptional regulator, RpiR family [Kineococcus radiotolerans SRS30216 = ATCC BAA-149]
MSALDETLLADGDGLTGADETGVLRALASAGAQVREALDLSAEARVARLAEDDRPRAVVIAALAGSSVVADIVTALAGRGCPVPVVVRHSGPLPSWVGPLDLVIAVSLSGRAPGPVALAAEASRRGARVLAVAGEGSPLAEIGARHGNVHVLPARGVRADGGDPRSSRVALWSLVTPVLLACDAMGLLPASAADLAGVADRLDAEAEACRPWSETFVNPAKVIALEVSGAVPVVLGDGDLMAAGARRAAGMLARTARVPAVSGALPDDASEVVATFGGPFASTVEDVFADPFLDGPPGPRLQLLVVRDSPLAVSDEDRRLADAVVTTATDAGVRVSEVVADEGSPAQRLAQVIARVDFAAAYLALASGIDPARSPQVADLKDRLG